MMHFTPQNRGKWIVTFPSTNRLNNTRIIHPILNLIVTSPSTNRIDNRGEGKSNINDLALEMAGNKTENDTTKKAHQLY